MSFHSNRIILMDRPRIRRTIKRISFQVAEKAKQNKIYVVGLNERGYAIASEIYSILEQAFDNEVELSKLEMDQSENQVETIREKFKFNDSVVLLVDDVMFTGRTMFKALSLLFDEPEFTVYTAVLVDRGHLTVPVKSEFVGLEIPTKPKEHIEMTLLDGIASEVFLYKK
jgi:pyrimidine operon attenuation protein / uracil phosphoribosyltransferase